MARIKVLPETIASQIAAGEVVERPASVVKELVENALDAGARIVRVEVAGGGLERITVIDDGCGMDRADAELAFQRHATSKISCVADLETVRTLGFRGEALPSIAAVSRVVLRTRPPESDVGTEVRVEGGRILGVSAAGVPPGTTVMVGDLFYNTPARKKFVRSAAQERALISETVGRLALSRPDVAFRLTGSGREVLATTGSGDLLDTITGVFGAGPAREMLPVRLESPELTVTGYVGGPGVSRSSRRHQVFIVNGRYVRSSYLAAAADEALHGMIPAGRHPVLILNLVIDPALVDVNVHPAKHEVRLSRAREVYTLVHRALREALGRREIAITPTWTVPETAFSAHRSGGAPSGAEPVFQVKLDREMIVSETSGGYSVFPELAILGFLPPVYLLARGPEGLYVIDQHAAHERVLYERFLFSLEAAPVRQQVVPATLELRGREAQTLDEYRPFLQEVGFDVEPFGEGSFLVRGVPAFLGPGAEGAALLLDMLERLAEDKPLDGRELRRVLAAALACHRAVRAGQRLSADETESLVAALARSRDPFTCPHGRPTLIRIGFGELARRFRRE